MTLILASALCLPGALLLRSATMRWAAWGWSIGLGLPSFALLAAEVTTLAR